MPMQCNTFMSSPRPLHPPKLRYSPSLNQKSHIAHAFFHSLENPSQVPKKTLHINQKMNPYTYRYNG